MKRKTLDAVERERERERRLLANKAKAYFACKNINNCSIINNKDGETIYCVEPKKVGDFIGSVQ